MPIKKLFFLTLIILLLTPDAGAASIREEDIWIYQGAYELGMGERAYTEGYTLKLYEISDDTATMLIYSEDIFRELFTADTKLNNEYIYDKELKIKLLDIDGEKVSLEAYKKKRELVWVDDISKTAFVAGDTLTTDDYSITLTGIGDGGALISVDYDGETFEGVYDTGDYQKFSEDFMMNVVYVKNMTQEVFIETLKPGEPVIKIEAANLEESYDPDEYVEYELTVTNTGTIPLHGITLTTQTDNGDVEQASQHYSILEQGKSAKFQIKAKPDNEPDGEDISITTEVSGYDYIGNEYTGESVTVATINPYISIKKEIYSNDKQSVDEDFSTDQYFRIVITVENKADFQTAATVTDELPESFIPNDLEDTQWNVALTAGETETIEYFASPTQPGDFTFGPAEVTWTDDGKNYTIESEEISDSFHVSGSKLVVTKQISSSYMLVGEEITVAIKASNDGDKTIEASFREDIPEELTYVDGDNTWEGTLEAGESRELTYTVLAESSGEIYLPATEISYTDEEGDRGSVESGEIFLYIDEAVADDDEYTQSSYTAQNASETTSQTTDSDFTRLEAAGFLTASFMTLFLLIATVPFFAYLYMSRIY